MRSLWTIELKLLTTGRWVTPLQWPKRNSLQKGGEMVMNK